MFGNFNSIVEVTGPTCCGKTFMLRKLGVPSIKVEPYFCFFGFIYLLFFGFNKLMFLVSLIGKSESRLNHQTRVFVHVFAKVGFSLVNRFLGEKKIIDEGLSHIPFILMLEKDDINRFICLFYDSLENMKIIYIKSDISKIQRCLKLRGHKRIKSVADLDRFVINHARISNEYLLCLRDACFDLEVLGG